MYYSSCRPGFRLDNSAATSLSPPQIPPWPSRPDPLQVGTYPRGPLSVLLRPALLGRNNERHQHCRAARSSPSRSASGVRPSGGFGYGIWALRYRPHPAKE